MHRSLCTIATVAAVAGCAVRARRRARYRPSRRRSSLDSDAPAGCAAALDPRRPVGDGALAPLRRDAPLRAARRGPRRRLALAARRHAPAGRARAPEGLGSGGAGEGTGGAVEGTAEEARAARGAPGAGAQDAHPGPHVPAHVLPLAAPGRDPVARDRHLRRLQPHRMVLAAAQRDEPAGDLPPQRDLAQRGAEGRRGAAAARRRLGRGAPDGPGGAGEARRSSASSSSSPAGCSRPATTARRR